MDAKKLAELETLAHSLGNVIEACRRMGVSRSLFYKWIGRRDEAEGRAGGKRRRHPQATGEAVTGKILALAGEFPEWGCDRLSHYLALHQIKVSATTVQKILARHGLGTRAERERKA